MTVPTMSLGMMIVVLTSGSSMWSIFVMSGICDGLSTSTMVPSVQ